MILLLEKKSIEKIYEDSTKILKIVIYERDCG